jgi:hypothetical protein
LNTFVGEALGGSVQAMMRAAGYKDEKSFFKAVEAGKILSKDVLPKFAEELKKMARANGALAKVTEKTRAETNRFFNQLYLFQTKIFEGGYGEGLAYMFGSLADTLEDLKPLATGIGRALGGALKGITVAFQLVTTPLKIVTTLFSGFEQALSDLGINDKSQGMLWQLVGGGGILLLMAKRLHGIAESLKLVNMGFATMLARLTPIIAGLAVMEDVYLWQKYGEEANTITGKVLGNSTKLRDFASLDKYVNPLTASKNISETLVRILFDDNEASKIIKHEVSKQAVTGKAVTQAENAQ